MGRIRIAVAGVGNCASALFQGIQYYQRHGGNGANGLLHEDVGGYRMEDIDVVAAFDIDRRKVGRPLEEALFAPPNCTTVFEEDLPAYGITVLKGPVLDGVAGHMQDYPESQAFRVADGAACDVVRALRDVSADVLVCYLPVGSEKAVRHICRGFLPSNKIMISSATMESL